MKSILLILITMAATTVVIASLPAADLPDFAYWSAKELKGYEPTLHAKVSGELKIATRKLADYGSSNVTIAHREANGKPEGHAQMDDYFVVEAGEAMLVIGGEIV